MPKYRDGTLFSRSAGSQGHRKVPRVQRRVKKDGIKVSVQNASNVTHSERTEGCCLSLGAITTYHTLRSS